MLKIPFSFQVIQIIRNFEDDDISELKTLALQSTSCFHRLPSATCTAIYSYFHLVTTTTHLATISSCVKKFLQIKANGDISKRVTRKLKTNHFSMTSVAAMAAGRYAHKRTELFSKDNLSKRGSLTLLS